MSAARRQASPVCKLSAQCRQLPDIPGWELARGEPRQTTIQLVLPDQRIKLVAAASNALSKVVAEQLPESHANSTL
jgi:hypothetical protein